MEPWTARVRYAECDQQGVVFNAHFLTYADEAATAWWEHVGLPWDDLITRGGEAMVKASTLEWSSAVRWGDTISVDAHLDRIGRTSLTLRFVVRVAEREACTVTTTYVWVTSEGVAAPWPDDVAAVLR